MELFDTHAHYNDEKFDLDREEIIKAVYESGITKLVNAGYSLESSKKALEIAKDYDWMYVICGISPNDIPESKSEIDEQIQELKELIVKRQGIKDSEFSTEYIISDKNDTVENVDNHTKKLKKTMNREKKIVAIGEIGLDYYWDKENKELQKYAFISQIELANKLALPIVIHTREAVEDTIKILKNEAVPIKRGIFHCCPLNRELVKEALKLGFYISFAGSITFKNSKNADEIISMVPDDKMVIETDSPYLSPEPNRGKRNDSRNVYYMAEKIANVKGLSVEEVAKQTYKNAEKIFEI